MKLVFKTYIKAGAMYVVSGTPRVMDFEGDPATILSLIGYKKRKQ